MMWQTISLISVIFCTADALKITSPAGSGNPITIAEGKSLQLNCSGGGTIKWTKSPSKTPLNTGENIKISGAVESGDNVSILTFTSVATTDADEYSCEDGIEEAKLTVQVIKVNTKDALFEYQKGAAISCQAVTSNPATYVWQRNGTNVTELQGSGNKKFTEHANGTLEFHAVAATREDAGLYGCSITLNGQVFSSSATLYAKPMVMPFEKSKNLVQEERLDIRCRVLGYPSPVITWFKDDVEIKPDAEGSRFKLSEDNGIPNSQLRLDSVDFNNAGEYKCVASASHIMFDPNMTIATQANSSEVILVRVKDKLAALWPFLGIVAEVVILCTIIFIYEKKRNKDAANEEALNQDGATPEKSKEGVRHRGNTNNPRA